MRGTYTTNDKLDSATGLGLSILETPQSVSVMTFERLQDQNLRSLTDVVIHASGVSAKELEQLPLRVFGARLCYRQLPGRRRAPAVGVGWRWRRDPDGHVASRSCAAPRAC